MSHGQSMLTKLWTDNVWLPNQIELITKLLLQIESDVDSREHYFEAIESILFVIENKVNDIVFSIHNYKIENSTV